MFCFKCGKEISDQSKFCRFCGAAMPGVVQRAPSQSKTVASEMQRGDIDEKLRVLDGFCTGLQERYQEAVDSLDGLSKEDVHRMHKAGFMTDEQAQDALNQIDTFQNTISLYPEHMAYIKKEKEELLAQKAAQSVNPNTAQEKSFTPVEAKPSPVLPTKAQQPLIETKTAPKAEPSIEPGLYMAGAGTQRANVQQAPEKQTKQQVGERKKLSYKERLAQCDQPMGWFKALPYVLWGAYFFSHLANSYIFDLANLSGSLFFAAPGLAIVLSACSSLRRFKASGFGWSYAVFIIGALLNTMNALIIAQYTEPLLLSLGLVTLNILLFFVTWRFYQKRENLFDSSWS